jgi:hypothetical protein
VEAKRNSNAVVAGSMNNLCISCQRQNRCKAENLRISLGYEDTSYCVDYLSFQDDFKPSDVDIQTSIGIEE